MCPISTFPTSVGIHFYESLLYPVSSWIFFFFFWHITPHAGLISWPGIKPAPLQWKLKMSTPDHWGSPLVSFCMQEASFKMCIHYLLNPLFPHYATPCTCVSMSANLARQYREISFILFLEIVLLYGYTMIYLTSSSWTDISKGFKLYYCKKCNT